MKISTTDDTSNIWCWIVAFEIHFNLLSPQSHRPLGKGWEIDPFVWIASAIKAMDGGIETPPLSPSLLSLLTDPLQAGLQSLIPTSDTGKRSKLSKMTNKYSHWVSVFSFTTYCIMLHHWPLARCDKMYFQSWWAAGIMGTRPCFTFTRETSKTPLFWWTRKCHCHKSAETLSPCTARLVFTGDEWYFSDISLGTLQA